MDLLERRARWEETAAGSQVVGQRVFDLSESVEHEGDGLLHERARDRARRGIDRDGPLRRHLGLGTSLGDVVEQLIVGVRQLRLAAVLADLAREDAAAPRSEVFQAPGLIEEGQRHAPVSVADDDFEQGAAAVLHATLVRADHLGDDRDRLPEREGIDGRELTPTGIAPGSARAARPPSSRRTPSRMPSRSCRRWRRPGATRARIRACSESRQPRTSPFACGAGTAAPRTLGWRGDAHHLGPGRRHGPRRPTQGHPPTSDRVRESLFGALESAGLLDDARVADLFAAPAPWGSRASVAAPPLRTSSNCRRPPRPSSARTPKGEDGRRPATAPRACTRRTSRRSSRHPSSNGTIVFLDPPYDLADDELTKALVALAPRLHPDATVIVERAKRSAAPEWAAADSRPSATAPTATPRCGGDDRRASDPSAAAGVPVAVRIPTAPARPAPIVDGDGFAPACHDRSHATAPAARLGGERHEEPVVLSPAERPVGVVAEVAESRAIVTPEASAMRVASRTRPSRCPCIAVAPVRGAQRLRDRRVAA